MLFRRARCGGTAVGPVGDGVQEHDLQGSPAVGGVEVEQIGQTARAQQRAYGIAPAVAAGKAHGVVARETVDVAGRIFGQESRPEFVAHPAGVFVVFRQHVVDVAAQDSGHRVVIGRFQAGVDDIAVCGVDLGLQDRKGLGQSVEQGVERGQGAAGAGVGDGPALGLFPQVAQGAAVCTEFARQAQGFFYRQPAKQAVGICECAVDAQQSGQVAGSGEVHFSQKITRCRSIGGVFAVVFEDRFCSGVVLPGVRFKPLFEGGCAGQDQATGEQAQG